MHLSTLRLYFSLKVNLYVSTLNPEPSNSYPLSPKSQTLKSSNPEPPDPLIPESQTHKTQDSGPPNPSTLNAQRLHPNPHPHIRWPAHKAERFHASQYPAAAPFDNAGTPLQPLFNHENHFR